jgi:hypothetical protein
MKSKQFSTKILLVITTLALAFYLSSCAKKIVFQPSVSVPAATGKVKIKKDGNNNYSINLDIQNLAEANRLTPPQNVYLVWIMTKESGIKNIGQIKSGTGLFSGKLKASLEAVSPYKPTRVFITAERNNDILYPGNQEVLTTRYF